MKKGVLIILLLASLGKIYSQNTCQQYPVTPYDIIQNPSFEMGLTNCTSGYFDQFGLTVPFWTTATDEMITGYLNSCSNFLIPDSTIIKEASQTRYLYLAPLVPQPIPDGNGVANIADFGYDGEINTYPKHKSYVSTCLPVSLQKDSLYRLEFYLGFGNHSDIGFDEDGISLLPELSPSPEKLSLFGLTICPSSPLPVVGCPEVGGWLVLGSCTVSGNLGTWVKASIDFTLPQDIKAIALGPGCDTAFISDQGIFKYQGNIVHTTNYSYFLDKLQLYKANISLPVIHQTGSPCDPSVTLQMVTPDYYSGFQIQWYKDGVLLPNEHGTSMEVDRKNYGGGYYQCHVMNDSVCIPSDTLGVVLSPLPSSQALGAADTLSCIGDTVTLNAFTDSTTTYTWQDGSTRSYFKATTSGNYSVTISNDCGVAQAQKNIQFQKCNYDVFVPNAFTPNGDGINDVFRARYLFAPSRFRMNVYNRYGQKIFATSDPGAGWDGTIHGIAQPTGTYVWVIQYTDHKSGNHTLRGTMELIR